VIRSTLKREKEEAEVRGGVQFRERGRRDECGLGLAKNCRVNCGVLLITYGIFLWIKPCAVWNSFCFSRILSNFSILKGYFFQV
jgi:hypothetical protein